MNGLNRERATRSGKRMGLRRQHVVYREAGPVPKIEPRNMKSIDRSQCARWRDGSSNVHPCIPKVISEASVVITGGGKKGVDYIIERRHF